MEKRLSIALVILGILFVIMFLTQENKIKDLKNKLRVQEEQLKYKDEVIESQVKTLIENRNNDCYCGWYEDFYYEHSAEVGAYE